MRDLRIVYVDDKNKIQFGLKDIYSPIEGSERLVQKVIKLLFTRINSDSFNPNYGCTFAGLVGGRFGKNQISEIKTQITLSISHIEKLIIKQQSTNLILSDDEKLKKIEIMSVKYNEGDMAWDVIISIVTVSGRAFIAKL